MFIVFTFSMNVHVSRFFFKIYKTECVCVVSNFNPLNIRAIAMKIVHKRGF